MTALAALSSGRPIVVAEREGVSTLVLAAQRASPQEVARMVRHTSGILRCAADAALLDRLGLAAPVDGPFTLSVDAATGVRSGVSAADRARTLRVLADRSSRPSDLVSPGQVFPVRVTDADGHDAAAVSLTRLAGLTPAAAIAELVADDGSLHTEAGAREFAERHALEVVSLDDLPAVHVLAGALMPTRYGAFRAEVFATPSGPQQVVLIHGDPGAVRAPLVRVHVACPVGERFGSLLCDCASRLRTAMREIAAAEAGVLLYLRGDDDAGAALATGLLTCSRRDTPVDDGLVAALRGAFAERLEARVVGDGADGDAQP